MSEPNLLEPGGGATAHVPSLNGGGPGRGGGGPQRAAAGRSGARHPALDLDALTGQEGVKQWIEAQRQHHVDAAAALTQAGLILAAGTRRRRGFTLVGVPVGVPARQVKSALAHAASHLTAAQKDIETVYTILFRHFGDPKQAKKTTQFDPTK